MLSWLALLAPQALERLEQLERAEVVPLQAALDHVQGIEGEGDSLWVNSVDRKARRGSLHRFERASGRIACMSRFPRRAA